MPQTRHGTACLDSYAAPGKMERTRLQPAAQASQGHSAKDKRRRIHESREHTDGRLPGRHLPRGSATLRRGRYSPRLHTLSRDLETQRDPGGRTPEHHTHRTPDTRCSKEHQAMGEDELLAYRQVRRPKPVLEPRLERIPEGGTGGAAVVERRTDGRTVPDDVLPRRPVLPLRHRLAGEQLRQNSGGRTGHLLPRPEGGQLADGGY